MATLKCRSLIYIELRPDNKIAFDHIKNFLIFLFGIVLVAFAPISKELEETSQNKINKNIQIIPNQFLNF